MDLDFFKVSYKARCYNYLKLLAHIQIKSGYEKDVKAFEGQGTVESGVITLNQSWKQIMLDFRLLIYERWKVVWNRTVYLVSLVRDERSWLIFKSQNYI